jgi:hypothetical protein
MQKCTQIPSLLPISKPKGGEHLSNACNLAFYMHGYNTQTSSFSPGANEHLYFLLHLLLLLRPAIQRHIIDIGRLDEELALEEFEALVERDDG